VTRGRFVAFEGGEASGKSTQAARLADDLGAVLTREPGGTAVGRRIRELLLDPGAGPFDPRAEALLMAADRAQHVAEVVAPALDSGRHVVTDRFAGSSLAYQGFGRGLPIEEIRRISRWATGGVWPDLFVLLDVPPDVASGRMVGRPDRLEAEGAAFHVRVAEGFRRLAAEDPSRWVVVDGRRSVDEVASAVRSAVRDHLLGL
jgi:dTMP kinase